MADINKNVGSTAPAQDYATITLWNAGEGAADPGVGFKSIANCYGDCGSTATINGAFIRGAIVQGDVLYDGSNQSALATVGRVNMTAADVIIKHMKLTNNNSFDNAVDIAAANCYVEDSHVEDSSTSSLSYGAIQIRGAAVNKGLLRVTIDATCAQLIRTGSGDPVTLTNVTGWGATGRGVLGPSGGEGDMTDCFFFDCNSAAVGGTWASKTNIATDDATGDLNPYTSSELFNFAGDNFQVKSTSFLATAGVAGGVVGAYLEVASGISLTVDTFAYSLIGADVSLSSSFNIQAESSSFSLAGAATGLIHNSKLIVGSGSYSLSGSNVDLITARNIIAENRTYSLAGSNVDLIYTPSAGGDILVIESGSFSSTGSNVGLITSRAIVAETEAYSLTSTDVPIKYGAKISAENSAISITGSNVGLFANRAIIAQGASYSLIGSLVTLKYSGDVSQIIGSVAAGFADDKYIASYKLNSITVKFKE